MKHYYRLSRVTALLAAFMAATSIATAAPRSIEEARQEAVNLAKKHAPAQARGQIGTTTATPQLVYSQVKRNAPATEVAFYVFSTGNDCGYTIVSGDDRLPAIVGYSDKGNYGDMPENMRSFMAAYSRFVETATEEQIAEISASKARSYNTRGAIKPLMITNWAQDAPYNNFCPLIPGTTEHTITGCVATATAQILYYHNRHSNAEITLKETIPAYTTSSYKIALPAIAAGQTYDWDNMLPAYSGNESQQQKNAVAKLMQHIGNAVKMDYTQNTSSASQTPEVLIKYFGMDKETTRSLDRLNYRIEEWDDILYDELNNDRPVYYSGRSTSGGHAFVIHGYEDGLYYVNWGWGGYCDGYFDITILNPFSETSATNGYSYSCSMIVGIQPDNGVIDYVTPSMCSIGNVSLSPTIDADRMTLTGKAAINVVSRAKAINTRLGIGYKDENGDIVNVCVNPIQITTTGSKSPALDIAFNYEENKTYQLFVIESADGNDWVPCENAINGAATFKIENGKITTQTQKYDLNATISSLNDGQIYVGFSSTINVTITNNGYQEYCDRIFIKVSDNENMPEENYMVQAITAPAKGSGRPLSFAYTAQTAGEKYFWICDKDNNVIGRGSVTATKSDPPILSFVSITCDNASSDITSAEFQGFDFNMNKVYGTQADFTFVIKNDGGYYKGDFYVLYYNMEKSYFEGGTQTLEIPGNSTTSFTFTAKGNVGNVVGVQLESCDANVSITGLQTPKKYYTTDGYYYFTFYNGEICCLTDVTTGITDVTEDEKPLIIYDINGQRLPAPRKGLNIINGRKVMVK